MDKRRSVLNISISVFSRIILLIAALYVRRLLIQYIGNDVNGLNSLYTSIIGMLAVAELGIGSAIVFSMYSPIVAGEKRQVAALYRLYRKLYRIIGAVILVAGLALTPFLPLLIEDYADLNVNVYVTFLLTLIAVVLSYVYSAKSSLIEAHKNNYLTTGILTIGRLVRYGLQIAAILIWGSFTIFLTCQIIETLIIWGLTEKVVRSRYGDLILMRERVDRHTKAEIVKNVKAMLMHKIGTLLVSTSDSLIISAFIGVVVLGKYMNYVIIAGVVTSVASLFFTPLTSVIGHLCAQSDPEKTKGYFNRFYSLNYILGFIFFLGYYAVIDNVVAMCFGPGLEISRSIVFIIALNQFVQYMRSTALLFRDASGTFYYDRWKPVAEGVINLGLSLLFVQIFPADYRVVGVIAATIITTLFICDIVEPYVVFHHVFNQPCRAFCMKNYAYIAVFILSVPVMDFIRQPFDSEIAGFFANGSLSVVVSLIALSLVAIADRDFRTQVRIMAERLPVWVEKALKQRD